MTRYVAGAVALAVCASLLLAGTAKGQEGPILPGLDAFDPGTAVSDNPQPSESPAPRAKGSQRAVRQDRREEDNDARGVRANRRGGAQRGADNDNAGPQGSPDQQNFGGLPTLPDQQQQQRLSQDQQRMIQQRAAQERQRLLQDQQRRFQEQQRVLQKRTSQSQQPQTQQSTSPNQQWQQHVLQQQQQRALEKRTSQGQQPAGQQQFSPGPTSQYQQLQQKQQQQKLQQQNQQQRLSPEQQRVLQQRQEIQKKRDEARRKGAAPGQYPSNLQRDPRAFQKQASRSSNEQRLWSDEHAGDGGKTALPAAQQAKRETLNQARTQTRGNDPRAAGNSSARKPQSARSGQAAPVQPTRGW